MLYRHGRSDAAGLGRVVAPGGQLLTFHDVGAVVYQLRMVSWQVKDFTVARYETIRSIIAYRNEANGLARPGDPPTDRAHVHHLHATILHLSGVDHLKLTFKFQGRNFRLTDVAGEVIDKLIA